MRPVILARSGLIGVVSMAFVIASAQIAPPAHAEPTPPKPVAAPASTDPTTKIDTEAVAEAADQYNPANATDAAELADAAATQEAVPVKPTLTGMVAETNTGTVTINHDGQTTVSAEGMPSIGMSVAGDAEAIKIIDGTVVQTEIAPSTDVVTRATDNGIQMIAILEDHNAPTKIEFPLDLPAGAKLVPQPDGSVTIVGPVETEAALLGEDARVEAEIEEILGLDALSGGEVEVNPTDAQWAALEAIQPVKTQMVSSVQPIATVGVPWAIDANGGPLDTHYETTEGGLVQVIDTDEDTPFPVVADPSVLWWIVTGTTCLIQLGGFLFAAAKLAGIVAKATKLIKASTTLTKLVNNLGGVRATLQKLYNAARGWSEGKATTYISASKLADLKTLISKGKDLVFDALGVGSCIALLTAK